MKKIYVILAVAALLSFAACGNKKAKDAAVAEPAAQEAVAAEKTAGDEVKEAVTNAAVDVTKEAVNAGAEALKNEIKK